jgi:hypothetical protein
LSPEGHSELERLERCASTPQAVARRARMILMAEDGAGVGKTAERLGMWRKTVSQWRALACQFGFVSAGCGALE